jgi:hypothetical protein
MRRRRGRLRNSPRVQIVHLEMFVSYPMPPSMVQFRCTTDPDNDGTFIINLDLMGTKWAHPDDNNYALGHMQLVGETVAIEHHRRGNLMCWRLV